MKVSDMAGGLVWGGVGDDAQAEAAVRSFYKKLIRRLQQDMEKPW